MSIIDAFFIGAIVIIAFYMLFVETKQSIEVSYVVYDKQAARPTVLMSRTDGFVVYGGFNASTKRDWVLAYRKSLLEAAKKLGRDHKELNLVVLYVQGFEKQHSINLRKRFPARPAEG